MTFLPVQSDSGFITGYQYDGGDKLLLQFRNGKVFEYTGEPQVLQGFVATADTKDSSGSYFGQNIKNLPQKEIK